MTQPRKCCGNCKFWDNSTEKKYAQCNAPLPPWLIYTDIPSLRLTTSTDYSNCAAYVYNNQKPKKLPREAVQPISTKLQETRYANAE